jgi:catechol 2,3-dioxygenase-like lactoylglutathione lyase family enzyme
MMTMYAGESKIVGFHSVTLTTPDAAATDRAYHRLFGDSVEAESTTGAIVIAEGPAAAAAAITFCVDAFAPAVRLLGRRGIELTVQGDRAVATVHGVGLGIAPTKPRPVPPSDLAGIDHVVYVSANPDRAVATLGAQLGLDLRLDRTQINGLRQLFFRCGDGLLELLIAGDDPTVDDRVWGIAWRSSDVDRTHARLASAGIEVSEIRAGRKPGTRVFTIKDTSLVVPTIIIESTPKP